MGSFRVLVVDDFERFRRLVCSVLQERAKLEVVQASEGSEAIQKAGELQPDLVVLDIGLPKLDGMEVARSVRELTPNAKIMFLSQESEPDVVQEALSLGALGYVHKARAQRDLLPAIEAVRGSKTFVSSGLGFGEGTNVQALHRREILVCSDDRAF